MASAVQSSTDTYANVFVGNFYTTTTSQDRINFTPLFYILFLFWHASCFTLSEVKSYGSSLTSTWRITMKMNRIAASLMTAATLSLASGAASAITVGGVTWDPSYILDFEANGSVFENTTSIVGGTISGHGRINEINGDASTFCVGCEVTYTFGGFTLVDINPVDSDGDGNAFNDTGFLGFNGTNFAFSGGWINVYVDNTPDFANTNSANSSNGTLWLSLAAIVQPGAGGADPNVPANATLVGDLTNTDPATLAGSGNSYMDVVYIGDVRNPATSGGSEGIANAYLDSNNAQNQCVITGGTYCPDMYFNSDFAYDDRLATATAGALTHRGSADIVGRSIPEPSALALLGIGLVGLGLRRRAQKAA